MRRHSCSVLLGSASFPLPRGRARLIVLNEDDAADLAAIEGIPFAEDGGQITAQLGDSLFVGLHQQHAETRVNAEAADQPSPLADAAVLLQQAELLQAVLSLLHGC